MNAVDVLKLVDEISQTLVLTDPNAVDAFEKLPEQFGDLGAVLSEMGEELAAESARSAISIAVKTLSGEADWGVGLDVLAQTCNALQACIGEDCSAADAGFPAELTEGMPAPVDEPVAEETSSEPEETVAPESGQNVEESLDNEGLVDDDIVGEFLGRQADILNDVEELLLGMEDGGSEESQSWLLRFFHTLKGESALLGMTDVADLCHATEDMMQKRPIADCVDHLLEVKDWFISYFKHYSEDGPPPTPLAEILGQLDEEPVSSPEVVAESEPQPPVIQEETPPAAKPEVVPTEAPVVTYQVVDYVGQNILEGDVELLQDFLEEAVEHLDAAEVHLMTIESDPMETEALNAVFRGFHTIKGLAGFIELDHVKDLAHKAENLLDMARRGDLELEGQNMDLVFESTDMMKRLVTDVTDAMGGDGLLVEAMGMAELMTNLLAATSPGEAREEVPVAAPVVEAVPEPVSEPVVEKVEAPAVEKPAAASGFIPLGNMKKKKPAPEEAKAKTPASPPPAAPAAAKTKAKTDEKSAPKPGKAKAPVKMKEAVRVDAERLDHLVETIGELVIAESMVSQSKELKNTALSVKLSKDLDHLDKICRELQEIGMSLRMVPVRPVFQKMARLVRDLGKKQNRAVDFFMTGEDTELDKNVVDKIGDPLVHMVRNSVDHGIEPDSADRLTAGKPERGRVELRAFHKGGNICIEIEDDGRGLDKDAILEKAISRGLVRDGENISDRDIFNMIFEAGFSTAKKVTEVSGRGVGMDVVRRNIEELRGTVDISSEKGKGSVFSIKLPLTLAIIEGMVIMVGEEHYIIPTLSVVRLIRPHEEDITHVFDKGEMLAFEGSHLPLFRLGNLFQVEGAKVDPQEAMVVVVEEEGKKIGIMADQLLGQQSIVIKNLGETVQGTDGVAGGAIMSDGNVALILDIAGLVRVAHKSDTTRNLTPAAASLDKSVTQGVSEAEIVSAVEECTNETCENEVEEPAPAGIKS
ncbi:MAG: chemotaxis protein CheA [bacterium]|nr:chemotaxis protein CheA [bacterium]